MTGAAGKTYNVADGGCVRNSSAALARCQVIVGTCVTPVAPNGGGQFWDVCLNTGARARGPPRLKQAPRRGAARREGMPQLLRLWGPAVQRVWMCRVASGATC